jgi:uncharacterized tellurite resistance protein B-like protein
MDKNSTEMGTIVSHAVITEIMSKLDQPNGFSKLQPNQRKFLLAAVLGSIVPADGKIRDVEMQHLEAHLKQKYSFNPETLKLAMSYANTGLAAEQLQKAARQLTELLSIEDRTSLIGLLWDIAICDDELHSKEETMIYNIADSSGVPRKRVVEQQARAQGNQGH